MIFSKTKRSEWEGRHCLAFLKSLFHAWLSRSQLDSPIYSCTPCVVILHVRSPGKLHHTLVGKGEWKRQVEITFDSFDFTIPLKGSQGIPEVPTTGPGPSQYSFPLLKNLSPQCVLKIQPLRILGAGDWGHISTGYTAHSVSLGSLHHLLKSPLSRKPILTLFNPVFSKCDWPQTLFSQTPFQHIELACYIIGFAKCWFPG